MRKTRPDEHRERAVVGRPAAADSRSATSRCTMNTTRSRSLQPRPARKAAPSVVRQIAGEPASAGRVLEDDS